MNTEFIRKKVRDNKGAVAGSIGGAGIATLLVAVWPFVADLKDANVAQWREISELKQRIVVLETKLEIERLKSKYEQVSH